MRLFVLTAFGAAQISAQEAAPRRLTPTAIPLSAAVATISGVRELRDGRLLLSDAKKAAVFVVDTKGTMTQVGSAGGDETQYAQPGGFYGAPGDSAFLLDRALAKVLVIAPNGTIGGSRSIKRRGVSGSSDEDVDRQRVDARGLAYFTLRPPFGFTRPGGTVIDTTALVRFDAARQHADTVALLRGLEARVTQANEHMQITQAVTGSPADEWGVAADGRVAVVHATPYRVDWVGTDGRVARGPVYAVPAIAYTAAEKDSIIAKSKANAPTAGVTSAGSSSSAADERKYYFADAKAPFAPTDVMVSPQGMVWVARTQPFGSTGTTYDVFNAQGERVDRVLLAGHARVVGFGGSSVYVVVRTNGQVSLAKYKL